MLNVDPQLCNRELTTPVRLSLADGTLNPEALGWSRQPLHQCLLKGPWGRRKRWSFWSFGFDGFLFAFAVADMDYSGAVFFYTYDEKSGEFLEKEWLRPLSKGCHLPINPAEKLEFKSSRAQISVRPTLEKGDQGRVSRWEISVDCPDFRGVPLSARLVVTPPPSGESLNVVVPWSRKRFHFTSKMMAMPVQGHIKKGDVTKVLGEGALASHDFGRGLWPLQGGWNWASAWGQDEKGRAMGLNLGAGWTDGTGAQENAILLDGKLWKLPSDVEFIYDTNSIEKIWTVRSKEPKILQLEFQPSFCRTGQNKVLFLESRLKQVLGRVSGQVTLETGETVRFQGLQAIAEEHFARW